MLTNKNNAFTQDISIKKGRERNLAHAFMITCKGRRHAIFIWQLMIINSGKRVTILKELETWHLRRKNSIANPKFAFVKD